MLNRFALDYLRVVAMARLCRRHKRWLDTNASPDGAQGLTADAIVNLAERVTVRWLRAVRR